jgi:hypothetical protein
MIIEATATSPVSQIDTPHHTELSQQKEQDRQPEYQIQRYGNVFLMSPSEKDKQNGEADILRRVSKSSLADLQKKQFGDKRTVFVVDCVLDEAVTEKTPVFSLGTTKVGWLMGDENLRIVNIDHHANLPELQKIVSSHHFATAFPRLRRQLPEVPLVITHTDPDSILSVLMLSGRVPDKLLADYLEAVIAADHTGAQTDLGDLISAIQADHNLKLSMEVVEEYFSFKMQHLQDGSYSFESFLKRLSDKQLKTGEGEEQKLVSQAVLEYRQKRAEARSYFSLSPGILEKCRAYDETDQEHEGMLLSIAEKNKWELWYMGKGVFLINNEADQDKSFMDNELLAYLVPEELASSARVVLFSRQMPETAKPSPQQMYEVKARVTPEWVGQLNLLSADLNKPPFNFGSRHNAGSTFRNGGTPLHGKDIAREMIDRIG